MSHLLLLGWWSTLVGSDERSVRRTGLSFFCVCLMLLVTLSLPLNLLILSSLLTCFRPNTRLDLGSETEQ